MQLTDEEIATMGKCPLCKSALRETKAERLINRLGHRKSDPPVESGHRHEYYCGAVMLANKEYPSGTLEATCCVVLDGIK